MSTDHESVCYLWNQNNQDNKQCLYMQRLITPERNIDMTAWKLLFEMNVSHALKLPLRKTMYSIILVSNVLEISRKLLTGSTEELTDSALQKAEAAIQRYFTHFPFLIVISSHKLICVSLKWFGLNRIVLTIFNAK